MQDAYLDMPVEVLGSRTGLAAREQQENRPRGKAPMDGLLLRRSRTLGLQREHGQSAASQREFPLEHTGRASREHPV